MVGVEGNKGRAEEPTEELDGKEDKQQLMDRGGQAGLGSSGWKGKLSTREVPV